MTKNLGLNILSQYSIVFSIFNSNLFFMAISIFGLSYEGSGNSKVYTIYNIISLILSILIFFHWKLRVKKVSFSKQEIILIGILCVLLASFFSTIYRKNYSNVSIRYLKYFLIWIPPAIFFGIFSTNKRNFTFLERGIDLYIILSVISILKTSILPFVKGGFFISVGGATYQAASYMAAISYGLTLYYLFMGKIHNRYKFTTKRWYIFITVLFFIPIQLMGVILPGGRGAMILTILYTLYILKVLSENKKKIIAIVNISLILFFSCFFIQNDNKILKNRLERTFQYFSSDGINWEGTSGRDRVYILAMEEIKRKPLIGYGFLGYMEDEESFEYPHNLFLEVLLTGGIIFFSVFLFYLILFFLKISLLIKKFPYVRLVFIIFMYPMVLLMFSGTYTNNSALWFVISYVFSFDKVKIYNKQKVISKIY